ncbi:hypothetical protein [Puniceibacterium sp. IMCC21224]|uniref:hypothetical protein n=1 Tax=Puniceibacterium sp. IMCC21224 TaxID=1618204 RepID=UPI00064DC57C|nr:hypothetical protein [Puniceibacterium sp. IMCC21224]KMK66345.1 hypothetical protein IMCC21224_111195 [Puniceibacterium sp. IMCC21224]
MALVLKVKAEALRDGVAVVPRMKSAALVSDDAGATVYIWLGDHETKSALHGIATLTTFEAVTIPQVRDPSRKKDAYRLSLAEIETHIVHPLTTDDLGPYRYVEGSDGIESLGRIHRDRNDKIMRLTGAEEAVLAERFRN